MVSFELQVSVYIIGFVFWEFTNAKNYVWVTSYFDKSSNKNQSTIAASIPQWAFRLIWTIIKVCIAVAWILHVIDGHKGDLVTIDVHIVNAAFAMLLVTEFLRKLWSFIASDLNYTGWALMNAIVLLASAVATLVLLILCHNGDNSTSSSIGIAFYAIYCAWVVFAVIMNAWYVWKGVSMVRITDRNPYESLYNKEQ